MTQEKTPGSHPRGSANQMLKPMVRRTKAPITPPAASLLNNERAARMSAQLTQLVEELAEPDVAWMFRNDRPGPVTEYSVPDGYQRKPSEDTTVFFPSDDVRGFYLSAEHWDLISEVLQARFHYWCVMRYDQKEPMYRYQVETIVGCLAATAWAIELIEHRQPMQKVEGAEELQMHWGKWFGLLHHQLEVATHCCPGPMLADYFGAVFTLRTQCCPRNQEFLIRNEAREAVLKRLEEIKEERKRQRS